MRAALHGVYDGGIQAVSPHEPEARTLSAIRLGFARPPARSQRWNSEEPYQPNFENSLNIFNWHRVAISIFCSLFRWSQMVQFACSFRGTNNTFELTGTGDISERFVSYCLLLITNLEH